MFINGLLIFLLTACYQDYRHDKIRNWLIIAGLLGGGYSQFISFGFTGILNFGAGFLSTFAFFYMFFKIGALGAGDVKLLAVCVGTIGVKRGIFFLCFAFLAAAVLSLQKMLAEHNLVGRFRHFFNYAGQVLATARFTEYEQLMTHEQEYLQKKHRTIHLAGPACLSLLLYLGGIY